MMVAKKKQKNIFVKKWCPSSNNVVAEVQWLQMNESVCN